MSKPKLTLVLGGASSGKSDYAERLASAYEEVAYIATAQPIDGELADRIEKHRVRRPQTWRTLEALAQDLAEIIDKTEADVILIDSMTLYVASLLEHGCPAAKHLSGIIKTIEARRTDMIIVSDEVGFGVVPATSVGRDFRDLLGRTNQLIASAADDVLVVLAGLTLQMKIDGRPVGAERLPPAAEAAAEPERS